MSASDKSRSTGTAPLFSNDTGPTSQDGEMSLPTPTAGDAKSSGNRTLPGSSAHPGTSLTDAIRADRLLPTPDGGSFNDGQSPQAWRERKARELAKGYNGNGGGTPIAMTVRLLADGIDPTSSVGGSPASPSAPLDAEEARMTTDTSGRSSDGSSKRFDPAMWLSRTSLVCSLQDDEWVIEQGSLFGTTPLATFSETFPRWGSMHDGRVYEHPMLERPTVASASSSLHTPTTGDTHPSFDHRISPGQKPRSIPVPNLAAQVEELLPTPQTPHGGLEGPAQKKKRGSGGGDLPGTIRDKLLPSPSGYEGTRGSGGDPEQRLAQGHQVNLADIVEKGLSGDRTQPPSSDGKD